MDRAHVVVIGAGFGGLAVARELRDAPVEVTVVDRNNFHTFLPLLYQVATSGLNAADVAHSIRGIFQKDGNIDARLGTVTGVDWDRRELLLEGQEPLGFDHLVVAAGSSTNYFGVPGAEEHAFPLYSLEDSIELRNRVLAQFEAADRDPAYIDEGALTFVVVGGGPTGVELSGAMAELFDKVLRRDFGRLPVDRARVVLVEMADSLLTPFQARSRQHAIEALRRRGVHVRLATKVESVEEHTVVLEGGERVPCQTLIWAAGVQANSLAGLLDVETGPGGRIVAADDLSIPGRPDAWVIGDIAHVVNPDGTVAPQLAPAAIQAGELVADNIRRSVERQQTETFSYRDKGTMATIGRRSAVAELPWAPPLVGSLAWLAWLLLHLYMLIGFRNRISVLVNWAWNYLTWDRGPRILVRREAAPTRSSPAAPRTGTGRSGDRRSR